MERLTSRKLAAAIAGLAAVTTVAVVSAWQPIPGFGDVLKALVGITSIAIIGQTWLDSRNNGK